MKIYKPFWKICTRIAYIFGQLLICPLTVSVILIVFLVVTPKMKLQKLLTGRTKSFTTIFYLPSVVGTSTWVVWSV